MNNQASLWHLIFNVDYCQWLFAVNGRLMVLNCFPEIGQQAVAKSISESVCSKGLDHE